MNRRYGFHPSLRGVVANPADLDGLTVVKEYDPRKEAWYPHVKDQLKLGACTANAANFNFEADRGQDEKRRAPVLSRLWTYYYERSIEGSLGQGDTGAYGSDAFTVAGTDGIPEEKWWPYNISKFQNEPSAKAKSEATWFLKKQTKVVPQNEAAIKKVLSNGQMISFGFTVYGSFEGDWKESPGDDPNIMPNPSGKVLGGHEINQVGFLEKYPHHILCVNSWNLDWQKDGHFLFPITSLINKRMCSDFRTIVRPL